MVKVISMYLPQFHRVKENDEWWGEGFTEWTAVKQATPLFVGHYQPHVPLNRNYYNLLSKETMQWQANLMKQYGIDGQCIYHYWFKNGRQILEKPVENLLNWKDIDMPFCFCWANESWARTWSRLGNSNSWSSELEPMQKGRDNGLLLEQSYGTEADWKKHFDYLLRFFKDERYIKLDNKPVFMIYKTSDIYCLKGMMGVWQELARTEGFSGIYLIGENDNYKSEVIDLSLLAEPNHALGILRNVYKGQDGVFRCSYKDIWNKILCYSINGRRISVQGIVGRDDTPRNGRNGRVVEGAKPEEFREYLSELIAKNMASGCEFTFINAWNEWGEGMHLEPDMKDGYGFLEGVVYAKKHYLDYIEKYTEKKPSENKQEIECLRAENGRYRSYWRVLDDWLTLKECGISLGKYFLEREISSVAIYGIGLLGRHFYYELDNSEIEIKAIIDRGADFNKKGVVVYRPEEELPEVGMIVVTVTYAYDEIATQLGKRGYKNIVSLEEIVGTLLRSTCNKRFDDNS